MTNKTHWTRILFGLPALLLLALTLKACGGDSRQDDGTDNRPPAANAGADQTALVGATVRLDGSGSTDPDGDALGYRWRLFERPAGSQAALSDTTAVRPSFVIDLAGAYTAELVVNDGVLDSAPDTVRINTLNSAPVADAGPDQTVTLGALVQLDGSASSDPDSDPLLYAWTVLERPAGSAATLDNTAIVAPVFTADQPGAYRVQLVVSDGELESSADHVIVSTANSAPVADAGPDQAALPGETVTLDGSGSFDADGDALGYAWSLLSRPDGSAAALAGPDTPTPSFTADAEGLFVAQLIVNDGQLDSAPDTTTVEVAVPPPANEPPTITSTPPTSATVGQPYGYTVTANDPDGDPLSYSLSIRPDGMTIGAGSGTIAWTPDGAGDFIVAVVVEDGRGGSDSQTFTITVGEGSGGGGGGGGDPGGIPPSPADVAPPNDPTVTTTLYDSVNFLFTGTDPIQRGVAADVIDPHRIAVLRGRILDANGSPLSGVRVDVKDHTEFGWTLSREDGVFDLAVNGGAPLVLDYTKADYLPAQRRLPTGWRQWGNAPDVVMITLDANVTVVDLAAITAPVVASGSIETDVDGARQARVMFKPGTTAELVLPGGGTQAISSISVRATEYTVGEQGPERMPGELPLMSGYTYAVELSVDEAIAAGASSVRFSQGVPFYVDNFLGFPTGTPVPVGYYDRATAQWVGVPNGVVIEILSETGGLADIDADGDGLADTAEQLAALQFDDAERARLAELHEPGHSLWRTVVEHFTPYDCNWPFAPPEDAQPPNNPKAKPKGKKTNDPCEQAGSIIECQNQVLGERLEVTGTPYTLNYRSDRVPAGAQTLNIPVTGSNLPQSMRGAAVMVEVAGRRAGGSYAPEPNQNYTFEWNGRDRFGRTVYGTHDATITIAHTYPLVFTTPDEFLSAWNRPGLTYLPVGSRAATTVRLSQTYKVPLRALDPRGQGLGGWALDVHHMYDPNSRTLYRGDGAEVDADGIGRIIETIAGGVDNGENYGTLPLPALDAWIDHHQSADVGPDGSVYLAVTGNRIVVKLDTDGIAHRIAGTGDYCTWVGRNETLDDCGVGGPATEARFDYISDVAVAPDGTVYIMDEGTAVFSVAPDGILRHVAGSGDDSCRDLPGDRKSNCALEGIATETYTYPFGIDVGPDGSLYIADLGWSLTVGRVDPYGNITTVVGTVRDEDWTGAPETCSIEGTPATRACLVPFDVAVAEDGTIYVLERVGAHTRISAFGSDGRLRIIFEEQALGYGTSWLEYYRLAVGPDGLVYLGSTQQFYDGTKSTLAPVLVIDPATREFVRIVGNEEIGDGGDGGPALASQLRSPRAIAVGPDGGVIVGDYLRVRRADAAIPGFNALGYRIASEDGAEVYDFDAQGRHLRTVSTLTGATLHEFSYDDAGRLVALTDVDGLRTRIEHDSAGNPTAIVGPYGQTMLLGVNTDGWLSSLTDPAGATVNFGYGTGGLLTSVTDPLGAVSQYTFDEDGRLVAFQDPLGNSSTLSLTEFPDGVSARLTSPMGRTTDYSVARAADGTVTMTTAEPTGAATVLVQNPDGSHALSRPDGTSLLVVKGPDGRFGMQAPLYSTLTATTPSGLQKVITTTREVALAEPGNPVSLVSIQEATAVNGRVYGSAYDAGARRLTKTLPSGLQFTRGFDALGRPVSILESPDLLPRTFAYDLDGRLIQSARGDSIFTYEYDDVGRMAAMTGPGGRTTRYAYDAANRVVATTLPDGEVVRFAYDAASQMTGIQMPSGATHAINYNPLGLVTGYAPPGSTGRERTFNPDRQPDTATLASGRVIQRIYDTTGRPLGMTYPEAGIAYSYSDPTLRVASIARDPTDSAQLTQAIDYSYDGPLLTSMAFSGTANGSFAYTYDANMWLTSMSLDGALAIPIERNLDGFVTRVGDLIFTRNGPAARTSLISDGTLEIAYAFNAKGKLTSRIHTRSGAGLYGLQLDHDLAGFIVGRTDTAAGQATTLDYTYGPNGQLLEVREGATVVERYEYDINGNRTLRVSHGVTTAATYDSQDRLVSLGGVAYSFDADGFLASKGSTQFAYSSQGELLNVTGLAGGEVSYAYDGLGRRVARTDGAGTEQYLYGDPSNPFVVTAVRDRLGELTLYFYDEAGLLISMERAGIRYYVATDQVGTPRVIADTAGNIVKVLHYDSWGVLLEDSNAGFALPFGFAGGLADPATGLVRFGFRDYDPEAGRWTARDPILFGGGQANLYVYAGNNPVGLRDPSGLACIGFSAFALFGGGAEVCMTTEGVSFCGELGLGFGGGLELDPTSGLAGRGDADYVKAEFGAECGPLGAGMELKLDDCGTFSAKGKTSCGIGPVDPCSGKGKLADVDIENGIKDPLDPGSGALGKANKNVGKLLGFNPNCKFGAKVAGGGCWSSNW